MDADLVAIVAADYIRRQGRRAISYLRDQEIIPAEARNALSAEAWSDIADAADAILFHAN